MKTFAIMYSVMAFLVFLSTYGAVDKDGKIVPATIIVKFSIIWPVSFWCALDVEGRGLQSPFCIEAINFVKG